MASEEALDGEADPMAQDGDAIDGAVDGLRGMLKKDAGEALATNESVDSMSGASALGLDIGADLDDLGSAGDDPLNMEGFSGLDGPDFGAASADEGPEGMFGATADASAGSKLGASGKSGRMDLVMSIPVDVQVILGTSRMAVSSLMNLSEGATIALDRKIGEPVEIMVSGKLIGRGEITVLESDETKFAVRIIEVIGEQQKKAG